MRVGGFPAAEEGLDEGGLRKATKYRFAASTSSVWLTSPLLAAKQTADALGVLAVVDQALCDIDHGPWAGRNFADLQATDPVSLAAWVSDPARGAPGGESLEDVSARLADWLDRQARGITPVVAVTHPMVIRAMIATALNIPAPATLRIDIAPLSTTVLSFNRMWRLQAIRPAEVFSPEMR
jgi:broad specificity phosphatase PhoE